MTIGLQCKKIREKIEELKNNHNGDTIQIGVMYN
jgi:hypothetical protein